MSPETIIVDRLSKTYQVPEREGSFGAGKMATLKMLSGLLHPTGGKANVLGFTP